MPKKKSTPSDPISEPAGATAEKSISEPKKRTRRTTNGTATLKKAALARSESVAVAQPAVKPQRKSTSKREESEAVVLDLSQYHEEIALLAYHLWEEGGRQHGNHEENWYRAQDEIQRRYSQTKTMVAGAGMR